MRDSSERECKKVGGPTAKTLQHLSRKANAFGGPLSLWRCFDRLSEKTGDMTRETIRRLGVSEAPDLWLQDR